MKEKALDRTLWRTRFGRGKGFVRHTTEQMKTKHVFESLTQIISSSKNNKLHCFKLHIGLCTQFNASLKNERKIVSLFTIAICQKDITYVLLSFVIYLLFNIARHRKQATGNRQLYLNLSGPLVLVGRMLFAQLMAKMDL